MQNPTERKYFYIIALMLMVTTYLPLLYNNLPPIIRSHHLWTTIWGFSLLFLYNKLIFNKIFLYLIFYAVIILSLKELIWYNMDDWNSYFLIEEFYNMIVGISIIYYFYISRDYLNLARLTKWTLIFFLITSIMTLISAYINPLYARDLVGVAIINIESERETIVGFKRFGGGNYSTAAAFMSIFPIGIYYFKNINLSFVNKRIIFLFLFILFVAIIGMQIFANILIALIFGILAFFGMNKIKQTIFIICLFLLFAIIIPNEIYVNSLYSISTVFSQNSDINFKLKDLALFLKSGADIEDSKTGTGDRAGRYPMLWNAYNKNPVFGCYFLSDKFGNGYNEEGRHLHWMNKLAITGILGLLLFFFIPYYFIKRNLMKFKKEFIFYYILSSLSILSYGLLKTIVGRETWYAFFVVLPGLYYLPLLKKNYNG